MLCHLNIRDFVLVEKLELELQTGFGTLSGETGAGKSILVDALSFALGERADTGLIRADCERTEVAAQFLLPESSLTLKWLEENDIAIEETLVLRRVLDKNGRSRAYINGSPVTVQQLKVVSETLVDIHGQHAHQSLLRNDAQRELLDTHAKLIPLRDEVSAIWQAWSQTKKRLEQATQDIESLLREREQLQWQVHELEVLAFSAEEWVSLNIEHKRLANAASLVEGVRFALNLLTEGDLSCEAQIDSAARKVGELSDYDPALTEVSKLLESAQAELGEAASALHRYSDKLELDPQKLVETEHRIEAILDCVRKFRSTPEALPGLLAEYQARLAAIGQATDTEALKEEAARLGEQYTTLAGRLSKERKKAAEKLGKEVSKFMQQLALADGYFEVALLPLKEGNSSGREQIEFRIGRAAAGQSRAIAKVASGGELSRISLAIQVVTSQAACVPTLIFDEVDVGIGGGVAEVVGRLLHELGKDKQVLCVTHLPQVAARADWQWKVIKHTNQEQVSSHVEHLDKKGRVEEIARMLGGVEITPITRRHAQEMLNLS